MSVLLHNARSFCVKCRERTPHRLMRGEFRCVACGRIHDDLPPATNSEAIAPTAQAEPSSPAAPHRYARETDEVLIP